MSALALLAVLARLACSTKYILGVAPVELARTPLEYLVSLCFIPVSSTVSYLGGLSTTNTSIFKSLVTDSAMSNSVWDWEETLEKSVVAGEFSTSRSVISLVPVAKIAKL